MATSFKHSKKRNSGLVYEFTVRHLARTVIDRDAAGYRRTLDIVRRYFGPGSPLASELELFHAVRASRGLGEQAARRVLREVIVAAARLDHRLLEIKKSNLIREVNHSLGQDVFSRYRVPEYRMLASLQLLINSARGKTSLRERVEQVVQLEEGIVRYMMADGPQPHVDVRPEVDRLVLSLTTQKFQERYGKSLSAGQRKVLESYARSLITGDDTRFRKVFSSEIARSRAVLQGSSSMDEFREDPVMGARLIEAIQKVDSMAEGDPSGSVCELMLVQRLVEEIENA